jgi:hypothetical protein
MEFVECSVCAAKPGSPDLCYSCLSNRKTIEQLEHQIETLKENASQDNKAVSCDFESSFKELSEKIQVTYSEIKSISHGLQVEAKNALNDDNNSQTIAALYALNIVNKILRWFETKEIILTK